MRHARTIGLFMLGVFFSIPSLANATEQRPASATAVAAPTSIPQADQVKGMIKQLGSVRDYERLTWILAAIDQQVPPVRADLLKVLDDQVQQLMQAEVERRTATALASIAPAIPGSASGTAEQAASAAPLPAQRPPPSMDEQHPSTRAPWVEAKPYDDVVQAIEHASFDTDPKIRMEQNRTLTRMILGVENLEQRQALSKQLQERSAQAFTDYVKSQQQMNDRLLEESGTTTTPN